MKYTSKVLITADYAQYKGLRDIDNRIICSVRQVKQIAKLFLPPRLRFFSYLIPGWVKIPLFALNLFGSKF